MNMYITAASEIAQNWRPPRRLDNVRDLSAAPGPFFYDSLPGPGAALRFRTLSR